MSNKTKNIIEVIMTGAVYGAIALMTWHYQKKIADGCCCECDSEE